MFLACVFSPIVHGHGAYEDTVRELTSQLEKRPDNVELHYRMALAHADHEEFRLCLAEIEIIDRLAPGEYPTGYLRGLSLHQAGDNEDARAALDAFLRTEPTHAKALETRSAVLVALDLPDLAASDAREALQYTDSPTASHYLTRARLEEQQGNSTGAGSTLNAGISKLGPDPELLNAAFVLETKLEDWDAALGRIAILEQLSPAPEPWMARRASLLALAGRKAESRAAWVSLRDHLSAMSALERGKPQNSRLLAESLTALGENPLVPVAAPPAS